MGYGINETKFYHRNLIVNNKIINVVKPLELFFI